MSFLAGLGLIKVCLVGVGGLELELKVKGVLRELFVEWKLGEHLSHQLHLQLIVSIIKLTDLRKKPV